MNWIEQFKRLLLALVLCVGMTWITDRDPPVDYLEVSVATEIGGKREAPPQPGGVIPVRATFSRDRICRTIADRRFVDSAGVDHNLENDPYTPIDITPHGVVFKYVPLPGRVHPGPGTLIGDMTWYCNPVHWFWPIRTVLRVPVEVAEAP